MGITKHELYGHPLYRLWHIIKSRCYYEKDSSYYNYGAKGVIMCDEWKNDFLSFYNWSLANGWKKGLQIDKDKKAPTQTGFIYSPEFCCFLTNKENMWHRSNSRMVEYNNEIKSLGEWTNILGLDFKLISNRYKSGWAVEKMFETPLNKIKLIEYKNKKKPLSEWCKLLNVDMKAIWYRVNIKNWSYERAFDTPIRVLKNNIYLQNNIK